MSDDHTINLEGSLGDKPLIRTGYELLLSDGKTSTRFPICQSEFVLGCPGLREIDIALEEAGLINRQAGFHFREGSLFFTNYNSAVPFSVNGVVSTFSPLKDGDQISFLHYIARVFQHDLKLATLEGCTEPYRDRLWGIGDEPATIGRGTGKRENLVDLNDRTVSRAHATITNDNGKFYLHPDTTSSPVRLNGNSIHAPEELPNGALLQLGQQLLRFRINGVEKARRDLIPQEATILFSDVWNYSSFAEDRPLEETILQMNEFYSGLGKVIKARGGVLLTFLGDAMMAVFGTEGSQNDAAERAVHAALEMQEGLRLLNQKWAAEGRPTLEAGVGINTGEVMVGDVGFTGKYEFAAMGDNTNLAARVEKLTREKGVKIIVTGNTRAELGERFCLRPLGSTKVKGRESIVELFGVLQVNSQEEQALS